MRLESASEEVRLRGTKRPMRGRRLASGLMASLLAGCSLVGPDFATPDAKLNPAWLQSGESRIVAAPDENAQWWRTFDDPALTALVERGYEQNLTLQSAGAQVLQARAQLATAIGEEYPQQQQAVGSLLHERESARSAGVPIGDASLLEYSTEFPGRAGGLGDRSLGQVPALGGIRRRHVGGQRRQLRRRPGQPHRRPRHVVPPAPHPAAATRRGAVQRQGAGGGAADRDRPFSRRHDRRTRCRAGEDHPGLDQGQRAPARAADRADEECDRDPDRSAAGTARRSARQFQGHPAGTVAGGDRHSGRVAAAPAGHPRGRGGGGGAECADRRAEGGPLPGLLADRLVRVRRQQLVAVQPVRHLPEPQPHLRRSGHPSSGIS